MATGKCFNTPDIVNGMVTVFTGVSGVSYDSSAGTQHFASGDQTFDSRYLAGGWLGERGFGPAVSGDTTGAAGSGNAVLTLAGVTGRYQTLYEMTWGYSADPVNGSVKAESPSGTTIWGPIPITQSGAGSFNFENGLRGAKSQALIVTLAGASGVLSVPVHRVE